MTVTDLQALALSAAPHLREQYLTMPTAWPAFVQPSPVLVEWGLHRHGEHQLALVDDDQVIARAAALPFAWDGDPDSLPVRGWDEVVERSLLDTLADRRLSTLCALEVSVATGHGGRGLSGIALEGVRRHARDAGFDDLIVPVRPSGKTAYVDEPMAQYAARRREDGLLADDWLRVHERAGAQVMGVCPTAMTVIAPLWRWREWTGLPFDRDGALEVPGAIAPVLVNLRHDYASYVEANVWMRHDLTR